MRRSLAKGRPVTVAAMGYLVGALRSEIRVPFGVNIVSNPLATIDLAASSVGVTVDEFDDGLAVHGLGRQPVVSQETVFQTRNDHRIAMSMALFGLGEQAVVVDNPAVVNKSFPRFWEVWSMLRCPDSK